MISATSQKSQMQYIHEWGKFHMLWQIDISVLVFTCMKAYLNWHVIDHGNIKPPFVEVFNQKTLKCSNLYKTVGGNLAEFVEKKHGQDIPSQTPGAVSLWCDLQPSSTKMLCSKWVNFILFGDVFNLGDILDSFQAALQLWPFRNNQWPFRNGQDNNLAVLKSI